MKTNYIVATLVLGAAFACSSSKKDAAVQASGGEAGDTAAAGNSSGEQGNESGMVGMGGDAGEAGTSAETGIGQAGATEAAGTGGVGGLGSASGGGGTAGGGGTVGGGGAAAVLSAIPGQDPTTVAASGPPVTIVTPLQTASGDVQLGGLVPTALAVDGSGNIILTSSESFITNELVKLDSHLNRVWIIPLQQGLEGGGHPNGVAADATGNIYVLGTTIGGAIARYSAAGTQTWLKNPGGPIGAVAVGADGTVYATGNTSTPLPNEPPTSKGGYEAHYGADGTLLRMATQLPNLGTPGALFVDTAGNSILFDGQIHKWDAAFTQLWRSDIYSSNVNNVAVSPNGMLIYDLAKNSSEDFVLEQRDPTTGIVIWQRLFASQMATLNAVEQEVWTGSFSLYPAPTIMSASNDAVYVAGIYLNRYMNGSSPPPASAPCYVARLDKMGNQLWFHQFRLRLSPTVVGDFSPTALALSGTKLLVAGGGALFQLNAADGSGP